MRKAKKFSKELVEQYYLNKAKTIKEICKELDCSTQTLDYFVKKYKITPRNSKVSLSKEYLIEHYVNLGKDVTTISKENNIKSSTSILNLLKKYNIPIRNRSKKSPNYKRRSDRFKKGYKEMSARTLHQIKNHAEQRNLEFSVTPEYIWDLFIKQDRKCALSGLDIGFPEISANWTAGHQTASLDRIDSSKGYIFGNVQWLHRDINKMKSYHDQQYFINLCHKISKKEYK